MGTHLVGPLASPHNRHYQDVVVVAANLVVIWRGLDTNVLRSQKLETRDGHMKGCTYT